MDGLGNCQGHLAGIAITMKASDLHHLYQTSSNAHLSVCPDYGACDGNRHQRSQSDLEMAHVAESHIKNLSKLGAQASYTGASHIEVRRLDLPFSRRKLFGVYPAIHARTSPRAIKEMALNIFYIDGDLLQLTEANMRNYTTQEISAWPAQVERASVAQRRFIRTPCSGLREQTSGPDRMITRHVHARPGLGPTARFLQLLEGR